MQLTHFTDLGLRVLMYLSHKEREEPVTITEIATKFAISRNHLVKVVHFMAQKNWIITTRGKGGGMALAGPAKTYRLGTTIRELEGESALIDCATPPCELRGNCQLKTILDQALSVFYAHLDTHTLEDALAGNTHEAIVMLHKLGFVDRAQISRGVQIKA
ncbi:Rrf2 family transcriptional regulator [Undibacterium sp. Ji49W]|uniref:Rrf2 family transcriptional regulator n=1 Tax=Undibacterium sp. Ji49W TaxID=3413040 RepID=UPI003BF34511